MTSKLNIPAKIWREIKRPFRKIGREIKRPFKQAKERAAALDARIDDLANNVNQPVFEERHHIKHMDGWTKLKKFVQIYYPETKIISINPVGLKGVFDERE